MAASAAKELAAKAKACACKPPPTAATTEAATAARAISPAAKASVTISATPSMPAKASHPDQSGIRDTRAAQPARSPAVKHGHMSTNTAGRAVVFNRLVAYPRVAARIVIG
jgi:hypothetical protein